ncbi:MAG TPA: hypothetical protein VJ652_07610 [Noviherbaspirillum sp.]|nr:hypothetical protein [Noviherbaspirillum sp.]
MKKMAEQGMLTKTYSSVALSHEQKSAQRVLSKLMDRVQQAKRGAASEADTWREFLCADRYYHDRALERHVIPAIRDSIAEANTLLRELETLATSSARILHGVHAQPQAGPAMLGAMEQYCLQLRERLRKEESELIPLAFRALTPEEWFAIAVKCLPEEAAAERQAA